MLRVFYWLVGLIFGEEEDRNPPRERRTYMGAITGTFALNNPVTHPDSPYYCLKTGIWLLSGNGRTAGREMVIGRQPVPELGKEVIHLNERMCNGPELKFGIDRGDQSQRIVIIGVPLFVATPRAEKPVLLTTKVEITDIPLESGWYHVDDAFLNQQFAEHKDVKVTVHSWVDGQLSGPIEFDWMGIIEVGFIGHQPG